MQTQILRQDSRASLEFNTVNTKKERIIFVERDNFARRLASLREAKGVSAREMSLSMGQSPNYINGLENQKNFPSMKHFFDICEYLEITPGQFFDFQVDNPLKITELIEVSKGLNTDNINMLINIAKQFKK